MTLLPFRPFAGHFDGLPVLTDRPKRGLMKSLPLIHSAVLAMVLALTSGCAFSTTKTQVNFSPSYAQPLASSGQPAVDVAEFKDSRPVNEPTVLLHKANAYGPTSGAFVAQRAVGEILRDGVIDGLKKNRFEVMPGSAKYELRGDVQEFNFDSISGVWTAKVKPRLQVRFELIDKTSGTSVWRDTFIGRGNVESAWGSSEMVARLFTLGAEDVVRQLISDPTFRRFFETSNVSLRE